MSNKLPSGITTFHNAIEEKTYYVYKGNYYKTLHDAKYARNSVLVSQKKFKGKHGNAWFYNDNKPLTKAQYDAKLNPSKKNNSMPKVKNYFGDALEKANESSSKSKTTKTKSATKNKKVKTNTTTYSGVAETERQKGISSMKEGLVKGKYIKNGKAGTGVYKKIYYKNGKPSSGYKDDIYYGNDGKPLNGTINGKIYKDGRFIRNAGGSTSGGNGSTGSSGGGNHSSSSASKAAAAAGSTLSASQYKNYNAHGLLKLVEDKFNQCFNATEFLKKQNAVSEITSALSKINSAINELDSISVSGNNDETYSTSEGRMVPIAISRINAIIDGSSTKVNDYEGHTYSISVTTNLKGLEKNLKQGLKKIAAAYYRKEEEDMVRFISYAKQIYNMVDSKKTSNNGAAIAEIKRKIKDYYLNKAPDRKKKAETHESACRASYESVISYYNGSTN